ncbi:helix-turn-helix transcriptional regulator [Paenibacillus sp. 3LSP]|jgi:transcriptional regulator with XRE-family HTH domain|uniref:helix-turn-helix domain-containing protein n=1 Tax=Paenibacillus sp. 3LSP TaxID=2800795 RepID=UPI0028FD4E00|nr:helix-turn-helix transcriptional regulator [Paenibacillus sp. 3LSP]MDU0329266.1 helix-turn-helix transcriptional regulator [Paenibacillus sp. 3LSP]
MEIFAKRLKAEREALKRKDPKWTQEYVADLLGIARPTYTAYENGTKQPPMETLNRLADIFDVDTDYLHGRSMIRKKPEAPELSFFGGPEKYTPDEIAEMEAALERYREMKRRAAEAASKEKDSHK